MKSRHDAFHRVWFKLQWPRWLHIPPSQRDDVLRGANPNIVIIDDAEAQNVEHNSGGAMNEFQSMFLTEPQPSNSAAFCSSLPMALTSNLEAAMKVNVSHF